MNHTENKSALKQKHLFYLVIFLVTLIFRFSASNSIIANNSEADIFINLITAVDEAGKQGSVLYQMLTVPLIKIFSGSEFILRFWVVMAGSIIVLLPLLFENILGDRTAIILSCLLMIDPFQIANGIQADGSALTMLMLFAAAGFLMKKEYGFGAAALFAFILSGPKLFYGVGLFALFMVIMAVNEKQGIISELAKNLLQFCKSNLQIISAFLFFVMIFIFILEISISDIFEQVVFGITNWQMPYAVGNYPQLFPVALLAYLPIGFIPIFIKDDKWKTNIQILVCVLISLLFIAIYPQHMVMDLVWVSLMLCYISAKKMDHFFRELSKRSRRIYLYTALVITVLVSLIIQFGMLIYKLHYGINMINEVLSLITLIILLTMLLVFLAYSENVSLALSSFKTGILLVVFFVQLAFSWRVSGLNGNPAAEIFWRGYFQDTQMAAQIIDGADLNVVDSGLEMKVAFLDYDNSAVKWEIGKHYPAQDQLFGLEDKRFAVVITEADSEGIKTAIDGYYGQDFIANSYPAWTWQPVSSLWGSDFWLWLIMRQGQMIQNSNYIWLNKNLF